MTMTRESAPNDRVQAGPLPRISPERMAEELAAHGRSPITWLIGAGFSHSAGLPLSSEVWQLLAISWLKRRRGQPGQAGSQGPEAMPGIAESSRPRQSPLVSLFQRARDVLPFVFQPGGVILSGSVSRRAAIAPAPGVPEEIDTEAAQLRDELLRALSELRDRAGPAQRAALSPGRDEDATYQAVFDLAAPTPEARRAFLSALLSSRCRGPNLAHLLLGRFLGEDRGPRTHTVFTVNFDDLLLESLLWQRKQARVFGDQGGANGPGDRPQLCPSGPQIVHLHGRGAGYLGGFGGARPGESADLFESFHEHLRESSLIVCGHGGGDERILFALRRWLKSGDLSGPLYWVVHDEAQADLITFRLGSGPAVRERVRLVVSPGGGLLSADELMMELCGALLPASSSSGLSLGHGQPGGGVLDALADLARNNGRRLHGALAQLAHDFPGRDPVAAHLRAVHDAQLYRSSGQEDRLSTSAATLAAAGAPAAAERRGHLLAAAELARSADVPAWRAQVRMAEMREHFSRGEIAEAQVAAEAARMAAEEGPAGLLRCQTLGLCGELALWLGRLDLGRERLGRLLRDEGGYCPAEWRAEARAQLLSAVLRKSHASRPRDVSLLEEARTLLDLRIDTPAAAVHTLIYEAEVYFLHGDLRRAVLVYETADEVAGRHVRAIAATGLYTAGGLLSFSGAPGDGLAFAGPAPGEVESEVSLLLSARQARFGLLVCRVAASRDAGGLPDGYLEDVDHFIQIHVGPDGEGQWMAAALLNEAAVAEPGQLRRAEEHAEAARLLLGPRTPPFRAARTLRTIATIALVAGRLDDAERHARAAARHARATEQYDEEGRLDLLLSQIFVERGRRAAEDERQLAFRRAVAHGEAAWLRGLELGSTFLTEDADDLLSSLRSTPHQIAEDVTPVPG